jgi:superfamily II DNA or RNA helicase
MSEKSILCRKGYILDKSQFSEDIINKIKKELTVKPVLQDNYSKEEIEPFPVFVENSKKISIPKYYGLKKLGKPDLIIEDEDIDIDLKFSGTLRPHQKKVLDTILPQLFEIKGGLISLPCGFGKTDMTLYIISEILKKKTLIIVHKTFLMNQWKERIEKYFPTAKVGTIVQDKIDVEDKDIVIGMLQSISMKTYDPTIFLDFGATVIDECLEENQMIPILINNKLEILKIKDMYMLWNKNKDKDFKVISYDHPSGFTYKSIDFMWEKEKKEKLYIFKIKKLTLKCTGKHRIYTPNGYEYAQDLNVGNLVGYLYNNSIKFEKIISIDIEDFEGKVYDISVPELRNFITGYKVDDQIEGIIVHNCHHIPSRVFSKALTKINSRYMIGLSATPFRKDKLEKVIHWFIGPMLVRIEKRTTVTAAVRIYNYTSTDKLFKRVIGKDGNDINAIMLNNIVNIRARNDLLQHIIKDLLKNEPLRQIMLLSDRKEHLEHMKERIDKDPELKEFKTGYYVGGMKKDKLKESESKNVIFGTYAMASEGLDIPTLDTIIMATPRSSIEQTIGRIVRKDNIDDYINQPIVIDIVDMLGAFKNYSYARKKIYKNLNYEVSEYNVDNTYDKIILKNNYKPTKEEKKEIKDEIEEPNEHGFLD